jgi:hypothetical protein
MAQDWTIREEPTAVPGWPDTFADWFVVVGPHGGRMAFERTRAAAEAAMVRAKAEWSCACGSCPQTGGA